MMPACYATDLDNAMAAQPSDVKGYTSAMGRLEPAIKKAQQVGVDTSLAKQKLQEWAEGIA